MCIAVNIRSISIWNTISTENVHIDIYSIAPFRNNINSLWISRFNIYRLYIKSKGMVCIMSEIAKSIGQRIRNYRTKQGLSQEKLAELSGCHPTYIGQLERGEKNATLRSEERRVGKECRR